MGDWLLRLVLARRIPAGWLLRWSALRARLMRVVPHRHVWQGCTGWSHATGFVEMDETCLVCFRHRPPQGTQETQTEAEAREETT